MKQIGDIRIKKKFAWIPILLESKQLIWLTFYKEQQIYSEELESGLINNELIQNKIWTENVTKWRTLKKDRFL